MEARMSILFFGKKTKNESEKLLSIYLRVTINGERFEISTQRYVEPPKWSTSASKVKGNSEQARSINQYLDSLKQKVYEYQKIITYEGNNFIKETLRMKWYGIEQRPYPAGSLQQHKEQLKSLIGKDNSKATYTKYQTTLDHTLSFLQWK